MAIGHLSGPCGLASSPGSTTGKLKSQLVEVEAEIVRLVEWIAKGRLVEDLERQMLAAEARRDHLRRELARARAVEPQGSVDMLPAAVRKIVSDLSGMLEAGRVDDLKRLLSRLVTRIEVHEDPRPGRKRPGACLLMQRNLRGELHLAGEKVTSGGSPGGILPLVTLADPVRVMSLQGHHWTHRGLVDQRSERQMVSASA